MANISGDAENEGALRNASDQVKRATRDLAAKRNRAQPLTITAPISSPEARGALS